MLTKRSMLIVLALLLAPFILVGCGSEKTTSPIIDTPDTRPPAAPSMRVARGDNTSANVMWLQNTEADLAGYNVYEYNPDPATLESYKRLNTQTVTGTGYRVDSLTPNSTYYFRITAVDKHGNESGYSEMVTVTTVSISSGDYEEGLRGAELTP